ncbi:unnamed protein product [Wuchereria bancrofti]|uniref:Uncharacterized protein n=1 Tax=Wuchereria bancrofti TaxID=6293 RepID=A0A3P7FBL5_WUCBA|nr:unnamed protein product [Wuchereria bancrofti]
MLSVDKNDSDSGDSDDDDDMNREQPAVPSCLNISTQLARIESEDCNITITLLSNFNTSYTHYAVKELRINVAVPFDSYRSRYVSFNSIFIGNCPLGLIMCTDFTIDNVASLRKQFMEQMYTTPIIGPSKLSQFGDLMKK